MRQWQRRFAGAADADSAGTHTHSDARAHAITDSDARSFADADANTFAYTNTHAVAHADRGEVVAYARHHDGDVRYKIRWWLLRRPDGWRAYDLEYLDDGFRLSSVSGQMHAAAAGGKPAPWVDRVENLNAALTALTRGETDVAGRALALVREVRFPARLEAQR